MKILFICALLLSSMVHAKATKGPKGILFSLGPSAVSGYESDKEATNGKKLLDADGSLGYNFGIELPVLSNFLTFTFNVLYARRDATTQYFDRINSIQADSQKSLISNTDALLGLRIRPLNMKYLKVFFGGGGIIGNTKLRHDTEDYIERNGPLPAKFKDVENVKKWGNYLEAGTEIGLTKNSGLRLMGQMVNSQTERFQTLNNKDIKGTYTVFTIQYMYFVEIKK